ncbi:tRNA uridine-5-carboxymethylaminomethyl(34) synthesis GTPase MnmE, partial [Candidatus Dependentiae bacterium]
MDLERIKHLDKEREAIIALCTPRGSGAIALLRLCGDNAIRIVDCISQLSSEKNLVDLPTHTIHHGYIIPVKSSQKIIDEVLFFLMRSPKTFTGQDTVEVCCHNNAFIVEQIIQRAIEAGARMAQPGEFTKRAFLNGKIDLVQAESINDVIVAQTELSLKKSMSQLQGTLSSYVLNIESNLVELLGIVEGSFEFFEEENQDLYIDQMIKDKINFIFNHLKELKNNFSQQKQVKDGVKICIIGSVNAGKSTLFNAILKKDRAIVTPIEGTTRDSIECSLYKNGNFWLLTDTAGLRQTSDFIEKEGIQKSYQAAAEADIILLTIDCSMDLPDQQIKTYKDIYNKYQDKIIFV